MHVGRDRFDRHAERVFLLVVGEASPRGRVLRENDRPGRLGREHVEAVGTPGKRLSFDLDRIGERDDRVLVGAGPPDLAERHELAPDFPAADLRAVVVDRHAG